MPVWKLTPTDLSDPNWEASSHRGMAVVRAPDEAAARAAAAEAFDVPTRSPTLVKVERIGDARYEAEGPTEILDPTF